MNEEKDQDLSDAMTINSILMDAIQTVALQYQVQKADVDIAGFSSAASASIVSILDGSGYQIVKKRNADEFNEEMMRERNGGD